MFPASDDKLINQALRGSQSSWVKLVQRYEGLVYNYCLRMTHNAQDAMDLMQEAFLAIYRHLPSYRGEGQFKAWMMRITVNKTMDFMRRRKHSPQYSIEEEVEDWTGIWHVPESQNPDYLYEQSSDNARVKAMLARLPGEQRLVVELKFFQHFTFDDISFQLGVPVSTVKTRLYTALQKLKEHEEKRHVV